MAVTRGYCHSWKYMYTFWCSFGEIKFDLTLKKSNILYFFLLQFFNLLFFPEYPLPSGIRLCLAHTFHKFIFSESWTAELWKSRYFAACFKEIRHTFSQKRDKTIIQNRIEYFYLTNHGPFLAYKTTKQNKHIGIHDDLSKQGKSITY